MPVASHVPVWGHATLRMTGAKSSPRPSKSRKRKSPGILKTIKKYLRKVL